ncbi:MAG: energy transducer TonB [Sterolibacterium sp.]|nr:energy transducer TonB [Sterolibacterium sp.]
MSAADTLPFAPEASPGKLVSMVLAVAVHLLLLAFLFYGIRWQNQRQEAVEVELVQATPPRVATAEPRVEPSRPEPVAEPELAPSPPKPEIVLKEKEKPVPKEKPKPVPKDAPKTPPSFMKQLEEEFKKVTERKDAAAAAQELTQLKAGQAAAARNKAEANYIAKIRGKIKGNIVLPPDLKGNPEAEFDVVQLPSGEILSYKLRKSSGHVGYDTAVERAILKSSPLPRPDQANLFERDLKLTFRPQEE